MSLTKTEFRFFTIVDYEEEAAYLRAMANKGWLLEHVSLPGFYRFTRMEQPQDLIYQLDFNSDGRGDDPDYIRLFEDCSWTYLFQFAQYTYFVKPAAEVTAEADESIFCDKQSRLDMMQRIIRKRVPALVILFFCALLPQFLRITLAGHNSFFEGFLAGMLLGMLVVYVFLFFRIAKKYRALRGELE